MKLQEAFATVAKYGRGNPQDIQGFLESAFKMESEDPYSSSNLNHPNHYLADYLEDNDDPRHLMVRATIRFHSSGKPFYQAVGDEIKDKAGEYNDWLHQQPRPIKPFSSRWGDIKEDRLYTYPIHGTKGNFYNLVWLPPGSGHYEAVFSEEEFKDFLNKLDSESKIEDFQ